MLAAALGNDLQAAALSLRPALADTLEAGEAAGALAGLVSGSGPTCVFLAADEAHAGRIAAELTAAGVCREAVAHGRSPAPGRLTTRPGRRASGPRTLETGVRCRRHRDA